MNRSLAQRMALISRLRQLRQGGFWLALWLLSATAWGAGTEFERREEDLAVRVDSRWVGCDQGGYYPIRVRITNFAAPRNIRVVFTGQEVRDRTMPQVSKRLRLETNASARFSLLVPMVSSGTSGTVNVYSEGSHIDALTSHHSLTESHAFEGGSPSLLLVTPGAFPDMKPYEEAVEARQTSAPGYSGYGYSSSGDNSLILQPGELPSNWLDYSGVDIVAISLKDFQKLGNETRKALQQWTVLGGQLVLTDIGGPATQSTELRSAVREFGPIVEDWVPATTANRIYVAKAVSSSGYSSTPASTAASDPSENTKTWGEDNVQEIFATARIGQGAVSAFRGNPFPGSRHEWNWWLSSVNNPATSWGARVGTAPRAYSREFLNFLIPGVGGVPIYSFLVVITLFVILIGPVNYWILAKRRQQYLMVITIPLLAFTTSLIMFLYSLVAEGFAVRSRTASVTWLDPQTSTAYSLARTSLYAPLAPSAGLSFGPNTAVYPIWKSEEDFTGGSVDWSGDRQHLSRGWIHSKTWTQFMIVDAREERGRIDLAQPSADGSTLRMSNGLAVGFKLFAVKTSEGKVYIGKDIPAGAAVDLKSSSEADVRNDYSRLASGAAWSFPTGMDSNSSFDFRSYRRYYRHGSSPMLPSLSGTAVGHYTNSLTTNWTSRPGKLVYRGVCDRNPGVPIGVQNTRELQELHIISGTN